MPRERLAKEGIDPEVLVDHRWIGAEIEHAPHALDDEQQSARIGETHLQRERSASPDVRDIDHAVLPVDLNRPPIVRSIDRLHAWYRARAQKRQHGVPVVRRTIGQAEAIAVWLSVSVLSRQPAQLGWCA